jgi:Flp pilus assembly pilin Flp
MRPPSSLSGAGQSVRAVVSICVGAATMVQTICDRMLQAVARGDDGQDLIEYALLVGLIAVVAVGAITEVGTTINTVFWSVIAASIP